MKHDNDPQVMSVEAYIAEREKEAAEKGERKPLIRPNVNYTSFVLNEVEDVNLEYTGKNEVLKIKLSDSKGTEIKYGKEIHNDQEYTYEVIKLDEKDKKTVEKDLKNVKWCFWLPEFKGFDHKQAKHILSTSNKPEHKVDFLSGNDSTKMLAIKGKAVLYAKKEIIEKDGKKTAILKVKFSKWLDGHKIKVEAYVSGKKGKGDTVATRVLTASPEILEAYWLNAAGRKITNTGYKQDVYLYLKTLGLKGKTLETQVFDKDIHPNPVPQIGTDDAVEWKNNKIAIEDREVIKQFKVGDKSRYKEAQQDEVAEDNPFIGLYDFKNKKTYNLELYIHIANNEALKIEDLKPKYGLLNLISNEKIINAFFAKTEIEEVQADAPEVKDKKTKKTKLPPKAKVPYYEKLNDGVIGQKTQLIAECVNLEGKEVIFKIYEKESLLVEKGKELPVLQKDAKVTEIKATVKNGYAVAEIELRHSKEDDENEDWTKILFTDTVKDKKDIKVSKLFLEVSCKGELEYKKEFLKRNCFRLTTSTCGCQKCVNYQDVKPNPILNNQTFKNKNRFKIAKRYRSNGVVYYHRGTDILASTGTDVHSLLCGKVANFGFRTSFKTNQYATNSFGNTIVIESKDKDGKTIYVKYCHLDSISVKKGDKIIHGQVIAKSGSTGNAATILYTSGTKKGKLKNGIKKEYRHIHIEASRNKSFPNNRIGTENDPETYMKTKFDSDGN